jgi:hypothetical protein
MSAQIIAFNPRPDLISIDEIYSIDRFRNLTEEQAREVADFLNILCDATFSIWKRNHPRDTDSPASAA